METLRDGTFSFTIETKALALGMRPSKRSPRNMKFLVSCIGAVGLDGVLQVIDDLELNRVDTILSITDAFPYPQVFVMTNLILVCDRQNIYEWDGASLTNVYGPVAAGSLWCAVDFFDYIYMSNGQVALVRNPTSGVFATDANLPVCHAMCNFNGQVVTGGLL